MWSHSKMFAAKRASLTVVMGIVVIGLAVGVAEKTLAAKLPSSPFAGRYIIGYQLNLGTIDLRISNSGDFSATYTYVWNFFGHSTSRSTISGSITDEGIIELTETNSSKGHGGSTSEYTRSAVGFGALDEDGNLYGVLQWFDRSEPTEFFWPRR